MLAVLCCIYGYGIVCLSLVYVGLSLFIICGPYVNMVVRVVYAYNLAPYQGITVTKEHGKYPVIFEPLQNVQTSRSTYKVTSFIDFTPYLEYFQQFEKYLEAFKTSIKAFENDPVLQEF